MDADLQGKRQILRIWQPSTGRVVSRSAGIFFGPNCGRDTWGKKVLIFKNMPLALLKPASNFLTKSDSQTAGSTSSALQTGFERIALNPENFGDIMI